MNIFLLYHIRFASYDMTKILLFAFFSNRIHINILRENKDAIHEIPL